MKNLKVVGPYNLAINNINTVIVREFLVVYVSVTRISRFGIYLVSMSNDTETPDFVKIFNYLPT